MNIFVLSHDPVEAAQMQCDKHVTKMALESAQMLCTVHRKLHGYDSILNHDGTAIDLYKENHPNHPCSIWARSSAANYQWLFEHFIALGNEYQKRYGRVHKSVGKYWWVLGLIPEMIPYNNGQLTPFALAMPDQYKVPNDPVASYRAYYIGDKDRIAKWKHGNTPEWYTRGLAEKYRKLWFEEEGYELSVSDAEMINVYQEKHNYWAKRAQKKKEK